MSNLFISHSSRDNDAAKELQARLEEKGHRSVFLDFDPDKGIQAGVSWERTLYTKLRSCRAVVALCSESYLDSQWCFAEIALARREGKELFVLQIDPWGEQTEMPSILTEEQFIDLRTDKDEGYRRLWNGFKAKGIVPAERREWRPEDPPYPGLRAFQEEDAPIFFGRDEEIQTGSEMLNRVRRLGHPRLVMVLGSSGSGKSSLTRAGIVPRLRRDPAHWRVVKPFRPGPQPFRKLAASLSAAFKEAGQPFTWEQIHGWLAPAGDGDADAGSPALTEEEIERTAAEARDQLMQALYAVEEDLTDDQGSVVRSVNRLKIYLAERAKRTPPSLDGSPPSTASPLVELAFRLQLQGEYPEATVVLVIDQFEELLGHDSEHVATRFLKMLRTAIDVEGGPLLVIGTMRSDYLGMLQSSAPLLGLGFKSVSVGPVSRDAMRQIIELPAKLGQIQLENGLADLLLEDTGTSDALPLLAFTMRMMWEWHRGDRRLEIGEYRSFNGLQGAIAQAAEEAFKHALGQARDESSRDVLAKELRDAFIKMARPAAEGAGWARQPVSWDQFSERVRSVLVSFIDVHRLLHKREDGTVEVAHEALFRSWDRLEGWLDEDSEFLLWRKRLRTKLRLWERLERDEGSLLRGVALADSEHWLAARPSDLRKERGFIEASMALRIREQNARTRRRKRIFAATAAAALAFLALASWTFMEQRGSERRAVELRAGLAVRTADTLGDPLLQALLLIEGARILEGRELEGAARTARQVAGQAIPRSVLRGHDGPILDVAFSLRDDSTIVTASGDGTARVWDGSGTGTTVVLEGHENEVVTARFDRNGRRVVTASLDGTARVWNADGSGDAVLLAGHEGPVHHAEFSPDGSRVVTASADRTACVWSADGGKPLMVLPGHEGEVSRASFDPPDGRHVLTVSQDGTAILWRWEDGSGKVIARHDDRISSGRFSHDGSRIVTASSDGLAKLCRVDGSAECLELSGHTDSVRNAVFSHDDRMILTTSADCTVRVWAADGSGDPLILESGEGCIVDAAFSSDDHRVVTAARDGQARVWMLGDVRSFVALAGHEGLRRAVFSRDGARVITASDGGTVRVWSSAGPDAAGGEAARPEPELQLEWPALVENLRKRTDACLTAEQRRRYLLESEEDSRAGFEQCERSNGRERS